MTITRRTFLAGTALGLANATAMAQPNQTRGEQSGEAPLVVSTWPFGKSANDIAIKVLLQGGSHLDAVEQGVRLLEAQGADNSIGLTGTPNAAGVVQLDACIMLGPGHKAGSVAALEGIRHPISVARRLMEKTKHVMIVGEGARMFALEQGFEHVEVNSAERYEAWRRNRAKQKGTEAEAKNHDTIALLVLGADGNIAGGCSTSGWGHKLPGRVGDSPIIGGGLYVDNEVGAAGATGYGENIMRYCGSLLVVEYMRQGLHPQEACLETIRRIARQEPNGANLEINFVALDKKGRHGAAGSGTGFQYSVTTRSSSRVLLAGNLGNSKGN